MRLIDRVIASTMSIALAIASGHAASFEPPAWAYPSTPRDFQPTVDTGSPNRLAGTTRTFSYTQIRDTFIAVDWYADHPRMPAPVARGRRPVLQACASCHLPNGLGLPQTSSLAGLPADYLAQQLADFKSGARHSSVGETDMATIARAMTAEEAKAAIAYYALLPRTPWITIVETATVPKTQVIEGALRIPLDGDNTEPLGQRIVEVPRFPGRTRLGDSHAPFIAYVPMGSIRRGRAFVASGGARGVGAAAVPGKVVACAECHGASLHGMPHAPDSTIPVPALAGRSPTYILRQLYDINSGARSGPTTDMMKPIAAQLTLQEMIDISAYLASKTP